MLTRAAVLVLLLAAPAQAQPAKVTFVRNETSLGIRIDCKPFATYVWNDVKVKRPYFMHLRAPNGTQVTRNHPPKAGDATDHDTMHPGLWLAFGDLAGADFWRNKGTVTHVEFVAGPIVTKDGGSFAVRNRYAAGGKTLCEEVCRITITARAAGYFIDWTSEFTGADDFHFGDQEEMGLGVRVATPLTVKAGGCILNSAGAKNEKQVWGKLADWCDYSGTIDGTEVGVALFPDPANFRRSWFHARDYGVLVANPFGKNAFAGGDKSKLVVKKGETFRIRFGVLVHSGKTDLGAAFAEWVGPLPWVAVSKDKKGFALDTGKPFTPWGFNYDHDEKGRLIEDYWDAEWDKVATDFAQMKRMGANVVRVHLQFGRFMTAADKPDEKALDRLAKLVKLAETNRIYLNLTGLACYHKQDVSAWYDKLTESERWDAQAKFWEAVAARCAKSPAIFCYDLMNEPVVSGTKRKDGDWLGPAFGDKHFVQFVTLDPKDRTRPEVAQQWITHLVAAVRKADPKHLVTVGLVDWSLPGKTLTSGFVPEKIHEKLDFLCVHIYPETGKIDDALKTLKAFNVGKPVVVEETFPLKCAAKDLEALIAKAGPDAAGWISFYWGAPPDKLRGSKEIKHAILLDWLERFQKLAPRDK